MKSAKIQLLIIVIGIVSSVIGIKAMLQRHSILFKPWFVALISYSMLLIGSLIFGFLIKKLFKSNWLSLTFTSILLTVGSLTYYLYEFKNSYTIYIPENYQGFVRLYISRDNTNDLYINDFGIGYISYRNFKRGIIPTFIKDGVDITDQISGFGGMRFPNSIHKRFNIDYLRFNVPGSSRMSGNVSFDQLVIQNAIDTSRLRLK